METTKYINTYFRINCGYEMNRGMGEKEYDFLKSEINNIFIPLGFRIKEDCITNASDSAYRNKESLYLHPMNFSGYILEQSINEIEAAIKASGLNLRGIDTYDVLFDEDAEFLLKALHDAKKAIREEIFEAYKTTRKTTFVMKGHSTVHVSIKLLDRQLNNKVYREFYSTLVNEMVKQRLLIKAPNHPGYYRALNKTELKAWERINGPAFSEMKYPEPDENEENLFTLFDISY